MFAERGHIYTTGTVSRGAETLLNTGIEKSRGLLRALFSGSSPAPSSTVDAPAAEDEEPQPAPGTPPSALPVAAPVPTDVEPAPEVTPNATAESSAVETGGSAYSLKDMFGRALGVDSYRDADEALLAKVNAQSVVARADTRRRGR